LVFAAIFILSFFEVAWFILVILGAYLVINGLSFILYYVYYNKRL
jgi:uncharacterized membrane protein HdeD (DUF308 family)